jgi:outer membrane immunogenic protein
MRRTIVASVLLLSTTAFGIAADLPRSSYAPPVAPTPFNGWSGFYVGGNFGGGITTATSDFSVAGIPLGTINSSMSGAAGGAQAGFNWQYGPAVLGVETDIQYSGMAGTLDAPCPTPICTVPITASFSQSMPWFGTVRARLGYAANSWLFYATGGYAYAQIDTDLSASAARIPLSRLRKVQQSVGARGSADNRRQHQNRFKRGARRHKLSLLAMKPRALAQGRLTGR